ncbi:MAG: Mur ligase family protein [Alphaproteobacteria bacterium]|nr:Mur ligase family protein [Alphaproteobacteria bacterium]
MQETRALASDAILERLSRLHPKRIDLSLGRLWRLLERLDHPERRLPPVIHVAGSNGKGSVVALLDAMLRAGGYGLHRYTSPHLVRFAERIRLADGNDIAEDELAALLEECESANAGAAITFFEITTAAALLAFARRPAEGLLLEVGLGGRLDATNVVAQPRLSLITPVSIDHTGFLGETLAAIAGEKAGILKPGVTALLGRQEAVAEKVIGALAAELGTPLLRHGRDWWVRAEASGMRVGTPRGERLLPRPALAGEHQLENAGLAVAALDQLDEFALDDAAIAAGLKGVRWPARLQHLEAGPLPALLPEGSELWLDGGHNAAAAQALAAVLAGWAREAPVELIVGMLGSKDPKAFLAPLVPYAAGLQAVPVPGESASLTASELAGLAARLGLRATAAADVASALAAITRPARVLICGSLYLAGTVLAAQEE